MWRQAATNSGPHTESLLLVHDPLAAVESASCWKMKYGRLLSALTLLSPARSWLSHFPATMSAYGTGTVAVRAFTLSARACPLLTSAWSRGLVSAGVGVGVGDADGGSDRGGGVGVGGRLGGGVGCALGVAAGVALGVGAGEEDPDGRTATPFTFGRFTEAVKPRSSCPS